MQTMRGEEIQDLLRERPFKPIELALSDGRSVIIRHPDQAVATPRHLYVGLAQIKRGRKRLSSPKDGDTFGKDWILLDVLHIVSAEPANGKTDRPKRKSPPRRKR